jgi:hypothetical protein
MKRFLAFFIVLLLGVTTLTAEEFTTGGVFVYSAPPNVSYNSIGRSTILTEKVVVGKTYRVESDVLEFITKESESILFGLSNDILVRVLPQSTFSIDAFNQLVENYDSQPSKLQPQYSIASLTLLDGNIDIITPKFDQYSNCILQTPLANIILKEGKFSIRSNPKFIIVNVLEGQVVVIDAKNKSSTVEKGRMGLIIPFPGRDGEVMVTEKAISPEEIKKLTDSVNEIESIKSDVLFIVADKKVVGVRLK